MSINRSFHIFVLGAVLLALLLPAFYSPAAHAQTATSSGPWYRYQGEPSSYDPAGNQAVNCGPASVAMAVQYALNASVPIKDIRAFIGQSKKGASSTDLSRALTKWGVSYAGNVVNAQSLRDVTARGNIAIVALDMRKVSRGADVNGASSDPTLRTGRYETYAQLHWIVVKGVSPDGRYFVVYDGNVWGSPGDARYWYSDGTPKGLDRLYAVSEVDRGMAYFGAGSKGFEITGGSRPRIETGQQVRAQVTYYTASYEETGKRPGDPGWGVMYNGEKVHWGAVAVDPEYIPLGTRMRIEGWGDQVFVAKDTGSAVRGWHVDVYWPGTREEAFAKNDTHGGVRGVTLLGPGPVFTDTAPMAGPSNPTVEVARSGAQLTRWVTLQLGASDPGGVTGMMISNTPDFAGAFEEPFAATKEWTLSPGDGEKAVYARFKNASGAWSETAKAETQLEEKPPTGSIVAAPDPRVLVAAGLSGSPLASVGPQPQFEGEPSYRPLGPNLLANSSFEAWAGGIPDGWDSDLREESYSLYEPLTDAYHGELALQSASVEQGSELTQKVLLKPDTAYTLLARVRGVGGRVTIEELQSQGVTSRLLNSHAATTKGGEGWELLRLSFTTTPDTTDARVSLVGFEVVWDALQLEEGEKPGAYRADGVLLERPATNAIANPSGERGPRGWEGLNSFVKVVSSPEYSRYGTKALAVRKVKPGAAATFHPATLDVGAKYTFSVYARLDTGAVITSDVLRGWYYGGAIKSSEVNVYNITPNNRPEMKWEAAGGGWYRGSYTFTATDRSGVYGLMSTEALQLGDVYYVDGAQLEKGEDVTSYIDGSLGEGYEWRRQAHRSTSSRAGTSATVGGTRGQQGSLLFWARPESTAPEGATLARLGEYALTVSKQGLLLSAYDKKVAVAPWSREKAQAYAVTWDGKTVRLYQVGKLLGSAPSAAPTPGSGLSLGPAEGSLYPNAVIGDLSLWREPLEAPEVRYIARNAPLNAGLEKVNTPITQVATAATDDTEGEIQMEWSLDGATWYSWGTRQGLREWDLGASDGTKTVWVRYIDSAGNWLRYSDEVELDMTRPTVASVERSAGGITVAFSEPVSLKSLRLASVTAGGEQVKGRWVPGEGEADARYIPAKEQAKVMRGPLQLTLPAGVVDLAGNQLSEPYTRKLAAP